MNGRNSEKPSREYRPYENPEVVRVAGHDDFLPGLRFEDLIGLVDRLAAGLPSGRLSARRAPPNPV